VLDGKTAPKELDPEGKHKNLAWLIVLRDVATRWNSTEMMVRRALIMKEVGVAGKAANTSTHFRHRHIVSSQAINAWVREQPKLAHLKLKDSDWAVLADIQKLLYVSHTRHKP
jgi:hypothetical protein